ncbi:MAG: SAM-dependent methyltransferase [Pseudomonadota bacterium]
MANETVSAAVERFFARLDDHLARGSLAKLVLAKYHGTEPDLVRLAVRPLLLRGEPHLSFVYSHSTRDVTHNQPVAEGVATLRALVGPAFRHAHLLAAGEDLELRFTKRGKASLHQQSNARDAPSPQGHDREKQRPLNLTTPFLAALGVTTPAGDLVPVMARKFKQINKFVEVLDHALETSPLKAQAAIRVADFGSGKGYLTFAVHHHLRHTLGREAEVAGVELRPDLVELCNKAATRLGLTGLHFERGDVRERPAAPLDIMIALHACDTATDHAIHLGIRSNASLIVCSPCCHKQIRPQLKSPAVMAPMLQHGIHLGQEAEMLTDSLRALLLQAHGYDTQVFEFVSLEHTSKNKMILAVKRAQPLPAEPVLAQIRAIKDFYAVREHCLETLLTTA